MPELPAPDHRYLIVVEPLLTDEAIRGLIDDMIVPMLVDEIMQQQASEEERSND